jgi:hypothetical protein
MQGGVENSGAAAIWVTAFAGTMRRILSPRQPRTDFFARFSLE